MLHLGLETLCPFCLQAFESAEKRTLHLIFDRCEQRFSSAEEAAVPGLPHATEATMAAAVAVFAN